MGRQQILCALACMVVFGIPVRAQGAPEQSQSKVTCVEAASVPPQIGKAVENLGHARFTVREQATRDLIQAGEPALPAVQAATTSADAEVRTRAADIVRIIQARLENDAIIRAPKIRIKFVAKPLDEALIEVKRLTGINYLLGPSAAAMAKQAVTVDTGEAPYWEAVEKFLAAAGLVENPTSEPALRRPNSGRNVRYSVNGPPAGPISNDMTLIKCPTAELPVAATSTLIRVKALPAAVAGASVTKGANEINFVLDVSAAPALTWNGGACAEVYRAVDEHDAALVQSHLNAEPVNPMVGYGGVMAIANGGRVVFLNGGGGIWIDDFESGKPQSTLSNPRHVRITLLGKDHASKSLKELSGVISTRVMTQPMSLLTIDNILTAPINPAVQSSGYKLEILDRKADKSYLHLQLRLTTPLPNGTLGSPSALKGLVIGQRETTKAQTPFSFQDADGKPINGVAVDISDQTFNGDSHVAGYLAVVPLRGKATGVIKLTVTGSKSVYVDVPFTLKNVPLP